MRAESALDLGECVIEIVLTGPEPAHDRCDLPIRIEGLDAPACDLTVPGAVAPSVLEIIGYPAYAISRGCGLEFLEEVGR